MIFFVGGLCLLVMAVLNFYAIGSERQSTQSSVGLVNLAVFFISAIVMYHLNYNQSSKDIEASFESACQNPGSAIYAFD